MSARISLTCLNFVTTEYTFNKKFLARAEVANDTGFPPIREIRKNFEDFFQSGKSGKTGVFSQNQGKKFQISRGVVKF